MLYEACAVMARLGPREVDELELWEIAAVLGKNRPPDEIVDTQRGVGADGLTFNQRRALQLETERPAYMNEAISDTELQMMQMRTEQ